MSPVRRWIAPCLSGLLAALSPNTSAHGPRNDAQTVDALGCPDAALRARVLDHHRREPTALPFMAAPVLQMPEAMFAAAMPADRSIGVSARHFETVWRTLPAWGEVTAVILKGGSVFEIASQVPPGAPSDRSKFFNLKGAPLAGHLRPDLMTAIHALRVPTAEGVIEGVYFYGPGGEGLFGLFIAGEGRTPSAAQQAAFAATWETLAALPPRCPASP